MADTWCLPVTYAADLLKYVAATLLVIICWQSFGLVNQNHHIVRIVSIEMSRICIVPDLSKSMGGPASFQRRLTTGLSQRGVQVTHDLDEPHDAVLVINSTRQLTKLWRSKKRGARIVQRLGNINPLQRNLLIGGRERFLHQIRNLMMRWVRSSLADNVVYQSNYVRDRWNTLYGVSRANSTVIYNGVDLTQFSPLGAKYQSSADICIISVEGMQGTDPFDIAVQLGESLDKTGRQVELLVFGKPWRDAQTRFTAYSFVNFRGQVPSSDLPYFYRGSSLFISTDILTAGCPNSVLEALACGTPVLGYKTGVLPELLDDSAGRCVECHGDPWKAAPPGNQAGVLTAAIELQTGGARIRRSARQLAEERYGLDAMIDAYIGVLCGNNEY